MKGLKTGIAALAIAALAITAVAVAAQTPSATPTPDQSAEATAQPSAPGQGQRPGRGQNFGFGFGGFGMGADFQAIADALGEDVATLRSDLQSGKTIADIANDKNVDLSTIVDAVVAKQADNLKTAVTDGRLTQEQADAQTALLKANLTALFNRKMQVPQAPNNPPTTGTQRSNPALDAIAKALGEDVATLRTDLQGGKTIADIAKDKNVDLSTVVDAVVALRQPALDQAVTDGRLTQDQADAQIALLKADLEAAFAKATNGRGFFGFFGGMGEFGGPMGGFNGNGGPGNGGFSGNRPGRPGNGFGGNRPGRPGNGGPMGPGSNPPPPADATPEATASASA